MGSGALILYDFTREDHGMYTINNIFLCCSRVMEPELVKKKLFITCQIGTEACFNYFEI